MYFNFFFPLNLHFCCFYRPKISKSDILIASAPVSTESMDIAVTDVEAAPVDDESVVDATDNGGEFA